MFDSAAGISAPPNFGQEIVPHLHTASGRYGVASHAYLNMDEALRDSRQNAERMRADCGIMLAEELVDPNGIREVLISTEIDTSAPQIDADQASRSFAIRAIYTYALSRPPTAAEKVRSGSIPMDVTAPETNAVLLSSAVDEDAHLQWEPAA